MKGSLRSQAPCFWNWSRWAPRMCHPALVPVLRLLSLCTAALGDWLPCPQAGKTLQEASLQLSLHKHRWACWALSMCQLVADHSPPGALPAQYPALDVWQSGRALTPGRTQTAPHGIAALPYLARPHCWAPALELQSLLSMFAAQHNYRAKTA